MARLTILLLVLMCVIFCSGAEIDGHDGTPVVNPHIISRQEWGARSPKVTISSLQVNPPGYVIIHHSATPSCTTQSLCNARVRSFQNYHMDTKKWEDIGYNFLVGEDGNIYEGRGWGKHGAHSIPYNSKSIGICLIGNFSDITPDSRAIEAVRKLIAYGVANNKIKSNYKLLGHRQTAQTICPGNALYNLIKTWPKWTNSP